MDLQEAIKSRRSIRYFSDKKIEKDVLLKIIEAGTWAPSHCNTQAWKFIFIDDKNLQDKIFENGGSHVVKNSPYGILVTYSTAASDNLEYKDHIQSASAAIQNMLLTIHSLGLGGCWVCHLPRKKTLRKILNIPKSHAPIAYVAFGYPAKTPALIPRKNKPEKIYAVNKFIWPKEKTPLKIILKRLAKKIYFYLPVFIKKLIFPLIDKLVKKFGN